MATFLILYVFSAVLLSPLVAYVARQKGHSGISWCLASLFFSPFFMALCLAAMPDRREVEWREAMLRAVSPGSTIGDRLSHS